MGYSRLVSLLGWWLRAGREPPWWCSRACSGSFLAMREPQVFKLNLHLLFLVIQYHNALNAFKRISLNSLHFQPLYFGNSLSFLRTTVTLFLLPQQREVISLYFSHFTLLWPRKKKTHWALRFSKGYPGSGLEKWWEDSAAPFEAVHRGDSAQNYCPVQTAWQEHFFSPTRMVGGASSSSLQSCREINVAIWK